MRNLFRAIRTIARFAARADAKLAITVLALSVLSGLAPAALPALTRSLVNSALEHRPRGVLVAVSAMGAAQLVMWIATSQTVSLYFTLQERTAFAMDLRILELSAGLPGLDHYETPEYRDKLALLRQQRASMSWLIEAVVNTLRAGVWLIAGIGVLASVHPLLLLLFPLALPRLWTTGRTAKLVQDAAEATGESGRLAHHLYDIGTSAAAGKELRIFGLGGELRARHLASAGTVDAALTRAETRADAIQFLAWLPYAAGYVAAIAFVALRVLRGRSTPGDLVLALALAASVGQIVQSLDSGLRYLRWTEAVVGRYKWLEDYAASRMSHAAGRAAPDRLVHGISFDGVAFRYPQTDVDVLSDVTLSVPAGTTVAIVGENGAGKTTLAKLLARFYEPTRGTIEVDGVPLRDFDVEDWRRAIAAGFQDFSRFEFLARENVGVGDVPRVDDDVAVATALERAGGTDVVENLPNGLHAQLGRTFAGGVELSGGQWQKLALGRAMMRDAPLLLILDEPTASLDAETEHALFERYTGAARRAASTNGAITVLVSHRFSTVRMADLIVVVDGGRVIEYGSHEDLIARGGLYAELYSLQAKAYR